eukprot:COSAG01_NODE_53800_length_336_cov_1.303797_1_plen_86_part_01
MAGGDRAVRAMWLRTCMATTHLVHGWARFRSNKPLDFERGGEFFRAIVLHAVTRNHRRPVGRRGHACSHADLRTLLILFDSVYFIM